MSEKIVSEIKFGFSAAQMVEEGRVAKEDIEEIRSWVATQNLPKLTDEQVVVFLLSCFNDPEATKTTIEAFFEVKDSCPKIFDYWKLDREDLQKQLRAVEYCVIPERRSDGCAICLMRLYDTYYGSIDMACACALFSMMLEVIVHDNPPAGLVVIIDYTGVGLMHLTRIRLDLLKHCFKFLQEGLPVALKEIHTLNTVYFIDKVMAILKPFMNKKVLDMLHFHKSNMDMEEFYEEWVPKRCLPEDYGGDLPPVEVIKKNSVEKLIQLQPYFDLTEEQRRSIKF